MSKQPTIILGAGPAGLAAAYRLVQNGRPTVVLEKDKQVGGLSKTYRYKDCYFDIGGHRFFTRIDEVVKLWYELLEDKLKLTPRISRIFYKDKFFDYPIRPFNALLKLGLLESFLVGLSYVRIKLFPPRQIQTFEEWVSYQFGRRLFRIFFKTYTEKVWGIPCDQIGSDWAVQRIKGLSLKTLVRSALARRKSNQIKTLIPEFHYPEFGPGMMYQIMADRITSGGGKVEVGSEVVKISHQDNRIISVQVQTGGGVRTETGRNFLSSIPITEFLRKLDPPAPPEVLQAGGFLSFRAHLTVNFLLDEKEIFRDNWLYIHSPELRMGRVQNYKNWSARMVYNQDITTLGVEYFCDEGDELWNTPDDDLIALAKKELVATKLVRAEWIFDGFVKRSPDAYPVYRIGYRQKLEEVVSYLSRFQNLQLIGRSGQYQYNNMDHSILSGLRAADNIIHPAEDQDIWLTNAKEQYLEY